MKKALFYLLFILSTLFIIPTVSQASHYYGGGIETLCLGSCSLRVKIILQADCDASINNVPNAFFWETPSGCTAPTQLTNWQASPLVELSPVCPLVYASCTTGTQIQETFEISYTAIFEYCSASNCVFTPALAQCCRDGKIISIANPASVNFALRGGPLDLANVGCNSTPILHSNSPLYISTAQTITMYVGGLDPDGDSIVYSLGTMLTSTGTATNPTIVNVTYNTGFSATAPFGSNWQVTIHPQTGLLTVIPTPGGIGFAVVNVLMSEYRNGALIGVASREIAFYAAAIMGSNLGPVIGSPTNLNGMQAIGGDTFIVCGSGMVGFDIPFSDPNNDTVRVSWDGYIGTGSFFDANNPTSTNFFSGVAPTARFEFTPPNPGIYRFRVMAQDVYCPLGLKADALYTLIVGTGLATPPSITVSGVIGSCFGAPATLSVPSGYASYLWSNGQTTPSISTNMPGIFSVTITDNGGCQFVASDTATMQPGSYITGNITTHLGAPLANQKVLIVQYNAVPGTLASVDTTLTDANGNYQFCNLTAPVALVKALPDSATYPTDLPTYADTALFWYDAVQFNGPTVQATVNFSTRGGANPGGPGFIGGLVTQGANKTAGIGDPIPHLFLAIQDSATRQTYAMVQTDANGYFRIGNLPYGTYRVLADWPNINHTDSMPLVRLSATHSRRDSLGFRLHSTYLELIDEVVVSTGTPHFSGIQLYPNPSSEKLFLQLSAEWQSHPLDAKILDLSGRTLGKSLLPAGLSQLDIHALENGIYWLQVEGNGKRAILKFVIQH